jgi:hypothetical protein
VLLPRHSTAVNAIVLYGMPIRALKDCSDPQATKVDWSAPLHHAWQLRRCRVMTMLLPCLPYKYTLVLLRCTSAPITCGQIIDPHTQITGVLDGCCCP